MNQNIPSKPATSLFEIMLAGAVASAVNIVDGRTYRRQAWRATGSPAKAKRCAATKAAHKSRMKGRK